MKRLAVIIGTHSHLPLGQPEAAAEAAYQQALRPFLSTLYAFPEVPAALHYSGLLLEWLEEHHPELVMLIAEMAERRQVEIVGGGYYDPILPMIPANDRLGQLEKMTTHLRVRFGTRPRGCWLAEQVWDPSLASTLRTGGMEYTFLDETQLGLAGAEGPELLCACVAEDQGKHVAVIPVQTRLVNRAASLSPAGLLAELARIAESGGPSTVVALVGDGARSGPPFASNGWLEEFLGLVRQNAAWLEPVTPSAHLRASPPSFPDLPAELLVAARGGVVARPRAPEGLARGAGRRRTRAAAAPGGRVFPAVLRAVPRERAHVREDDAHPRAREPAARRPLPETCRAERAVEGPEPPRLLVRRRRAACTRTRSARPSTGR